MMKTLNIVLLFIVVINSKAQTFHEELYGNLENPIFFQIYEDENILITNNNSDTTFAGLLKFNSEIPGIVVIKPQPGYNIAIVPIIFSGSNMGAGTSIGGSTGGGGGGGLDSKTTLYPNPAYNLIQLQSTENIVGYKIYDAQGILKSEKSFLKSDDFSVHINNLSPGIYYINILLENGQMISKQFIKQ